MEEKDYTTCKFIKSIGKYAVYVSPSCRQYIMIHGKCVVNKARCHRCYKQDNANLIPIYPTKYLFKGGLLRYYVAPGRYGFAIYEVGYSLPLFPTEYFTENSARIDCMKFNAFGTEKIMEIYWMRYVVGTHPLETKPKTYSEWREENKRWFYRRDRRCAIER